MLPRTVGGVVAGRDDVERELALRLGDGLLGPTATYERIRRGERERQVGGDSVVLEVPVVGPEQVELEVLRALMLDVRAIDHHAQPEVPWRGRERMLEAGDARGQRRPVAALGGPLLQGQPAPVADLDGVARTSPV